MSENTLSSVINILPPHVADMIAAGEVVERPASVIKELVENSFDAGAKNVTVEIRGGGSAYIRVTDDGCGMSPEDAGVAFLRHATSKLKDEYGLEAIGTMGFRGEALAAISAVSRVELVTRRSRDRVGTAVSLLAGEIQSMDETGCPAGTSIIIRDLFYNTPARQKFLKSDRSEASACQLAALRCALSRPEVSLRFLKDGEEQFFSPGSGDAMACIYSVLGRDLAADLLPVIGESDGLTLRGQVSSPAACRGNRGAQYFFVNGRFIKSQAMQTALEQAYRNSLLSGRYPACVLYLTVPLGSVDVNVHPAKTEVKFSDEKRIFDLVYHSVQAALEGESRVLPARPAAPAPAKSAAAQLAQAAQAAEAGRKQDFFHSMSAGEYREKAAGKPATAPKKEETFPLFSAPPEAYQTRLDLTPSPRPAASVKPAAAPVSARPATEKKPAAPASAPISTEKAVEKPVQNVENSPLPDHKIVGELFKKYIVVELGSQILLIDKHAAHERMNFDRLRAAQGPLMSQTLLAPAPLHLEAEDCEALTANGELLEQLGFEIEPLNEGNFVIRAIPADMAAADAVPALEEICDKLRRGDAPDPAAARDEILHTVACKAAIKAGWDTSAAELERVTAEVLSGRVLYCPHGRPVSFTLDQDWLDKQFKRIV